MLQAIYPDYDVEVTATFRWRVTATEALDASGLAEGHNPPGRPDSIDRLTGAMLSASGRIRNLTKDTIGPANILKVSATKVVE